MALYDPSILQRNREWRRCVRVRARIKASDGWRDASILNVSSSGLMIHSSCCSNPGSEVELRGGDQVIRARVVWLKGQRAGLRSDMALPLMDFISLTEGSPANQALEAARKAGACTRTNRTAAVQSNQWSRLVELGSTLVIAVVIVTGFVSMGGRLLVEQFGAVASALHR